MSAEELRKAFLTSGLSESQREELLAASEEIRFERGDLLFAEGDRSDYLWILLEGSIVLTRQSASEAIVLATMSTPGQWAGGLTAWGDSGSSAGYRATGHGGDPGRCLRVGSAELGRLVGEWFPFGKHMIVGIYQTVRGIEAMARQRESLVALGTLAAGLAHEINNPVAASMRAVDGLRRECDDMLSSLTALARNTITAEQYVALDALRVDASTTGPTDEDPLAASDREEVIGQWLAERSVEEAWQLAPTLASTGADQLWLERVESAVGPDALEPAVRWLVSTISANSLLNEMHETTTRISQLIESVKSYSQLDRASLQSVNVHDGIESTLVMLDHRLHEIDVTRDFAAELPEIEAYPGELNQVWTNLIDNAVDAMEGSGSLRVSTSLEGSDLIVEVSDTGPGMPAAVQDRAFEPFFTTKDVGKGTGLGLDISRRIVAERHGGDITFDSSPAGTTARVRIPLRR